METTRTVMLPATTDEARRRSSTQIPAVRVPTTPSDEEMAAITAHFERRSEAFHARLERNHQVSTAETVRPARRAR